MAHWFTIFYATITFQLFACERAIFSENSEQIVITKTIGMKLYPNYCKRKRSPGAITIPAPSRGLVPVRTWLLIGNLPAYHPDRNRKEGHGRQSDTGTSRRSRGPRGQWQNHKMSRQQRGQINKHERWTCTRTVGLRQMKPCVEPLPSRSNELNQKLCEVNLT